MTIDEMIKRIKEKMACDYNISGCDTCNISRCEDKDIVIQLAEWLEELKELRSMTASHLYAVAFNRGYLKAEKEVREKAIDDFVRFASDMPTVETEDGEIRPMWLEEIAEQLKAGEDNV